MSTQPAPSAADVREAGETARSDAKRRAILGVASDIFLAQGYAATSMSEIAAKVGGSKATLYNYFRSKDELFEAFMADTCQSLAAAIFDRIAPIGEGRSVRDSLIELGEALLDFLLLDRIVAVHRLVVAEAGRFPELGRVYYEVGPRKGEARFTQILERAMAAGHLPREDPHMVGQRLKDLVMSDLYLRRLWGVIDAIGREELRAHVTQSVDIFLRAFGPKPSR
jgi:AcrR family transcriptional regulator